MKSLIIGVDDRWNDGGIGRFSREIQSRLPSAGATIKKLKIASAIAEPLSPVAIARAIRAKESDVFWSPGFMPPISSSVPVVITMHDLIHRRYGGYARRQYYDRFIRPMARRSHTILTVSDYSRTEIVEWLGSNSCDVRVVGNGVSEVFRPAETSLDLGGPYFLYAGNFRQHKNIGRMIKAFASSRMLREMYLVCTGRQDIEVMQWANQCGVGKRIRFLGGLDERALADAYRGARATVLISLEEGFGLPVIEAMACGTPVVCSSTTSLGEVAADAAILVDPCDIDATAEAMERVINDEELRSRLRSRGLERAANFTWENVTNRTFEALSRAAGA